MNISFLAENAHIPKFLVQKCVRRIKNGVFTIRITRWRLNRPACETDFDRTVALPKIIIGI